MSIQEKRAVVSIVTTVITFVVYYIFIIRLYQGEDHTITEQLKFWGASILILLPIMIVSKIVMYIMFSIINTIITRQKEEQFLTDEYGRLIESRATKNFHCVFMLGFFASMGSLAFGMPLLIMFNILLASVLIGLVTLDLSSIYYLRKGIN